MKAINLNIEGLKFFIDNNEYQMMENKVKMAHDMLENKTGAGRSMLGFIDLPERITEEEINKIKECANKIRTESEVLIVIGAGGSYLGSKAIIDMFSDSFYNMQNITKRKGPMILFAGNNLSGKYLRNLLELIDDKEVSLNVISKSGKTLEPALSFRVLKLYMEERYGISGAAERIYVTTDETEGTLKKIADKEGYETFVVPRDVGGRYSVLSAVGLLPMAVAGIDFEEVLDGALFARQAYNVSRIYDNDAYMYAAIRNIFYDKGKDIEVFATFEPSMDSFSKWYQQLFGESEGKSEKGLFPTTLSYTADLHSMGQYMQDGKRNMFETIITVKNDNSFIKVPGTEENEDELNYIEGMALCDINNKAEKGVYTAHIAGQVPVIEIELADLSEYSIGQLIYFFEKACAISAYILGVNPFDQPGVELYKENVMNLLKEN